MKITPIEIRQKTFEKGFRGYEKEEVDAFLVSLSQEWERVAGDIQDLKSRLSLADGDVRKLREVESSLYRTLKTAEDTGANMMQQANRDAELQLREAQMQSEAILNDAKNQARDLIDDAELRAREISGELRDDLKKLEQDYRILEGYRNNMASEMRSFANGTLDRLENQNFQKVDFGSIMKSTNNEFESKAFQEPLLGETPVVKEEKEVFVSQEVVLEINGEITEEVIEPEIEVRPEIKALPAEPTPIEVPKAEPAPEEKSNEPKGGSFFDNLD